MAALGPRRVDRCRGDCRRRGPATSGCDLVAAAGARRPSRYSAAATSSDMARPGRDLGASRRPELGEDVLDVGRRRLGRDPQGGRDLRVRTALADESGDLELARRERVPRLFVDTWPRAIRSTASARAANGGLSRREAVGEPRPRRAPRRRSGAARMWLAARSSRAQFASQTRPCVSQPRAASSAGSARPWSSPTRGQQSATMSDRRVRDVERIEVWRRIRRASQPPPPADPWRVRRGPGHDERHEQRPLPDCLPRRSASWQRAAPAAGLAQEQGRLGEAPGRRQEQVERLACPPRIRPRLQLGAWPRQVAAPQGEVPECPASRRRPAGSHGR